MTPDFLLIQRVKNGDKQAGGQLIEKYYASIYQYCLLHIHDYDCAEDMTQETFVRFFESIQTYTDCGKTKNYLYCIAGNIVKNYYKKKKEVLLDELPEIAEKSMDDLVLKIDIERALDRLPDDLREIAILYFFQDFKQREIAKFLNINLSLVKYRVSRTKKLLSEYLEVKRK